MTTETSREEPKGSQTQTALRAKWGLKK